MKQRIILVEYLNYVNSSGEAVGHGRKVLEEAFSLLPDGYEAGCAACEAYRPAGFSGALLPLRAVRPADRRTAAHGEIFDNLRRVFAMAGKNDVLWFTNTEWHLMTFLAFCPRGRKVIATVYRDILADVGLSRFAFLKSGPVRRGLRRVDLTVVTNRHLKIGRRQIFLPDYIYSDWYDRYQSARKQDRVLCVGVMRASRDLRGVIEHFRGTDVPVYIAGSFPDREEFQRLLEQATENIRMEDRLIPYEEYYTLIAESRFVILPYDMAAYHSATSGILLECAFLRSIPIAPQELLDENGIQGIGYRKLEELPQRMQALLARGERVHNDMEAYRPSVVQETLRTGLRDLLEGLC